MVPVTSGIFARDPYALQPDAMVLPGGVMTDSPVLVVDAGGVGFAGHRQGALGRYPGIEIERIKGKVIVPGFVDTHHHVTPSFVKAISFGEPAQMWTRIWMPYEAALDPEMSYYGAKWTFVEALRGGFTTLVDSAIRPAEHTAAVLKAADECGIRLVLSTGVFDLSDFGTEAPTPDLGGSIHGVVELAEEHLDMCAGYANVEPSMACGTVQSNSGRLITALARWCQEHDVLFQIHANEHTGEVHRSVERHGLRPIQYLDALDALGPMTLLAHTTLVTPAEARRLRDTDTAVSYNPVASQWKGNAVAPALWFHELGIRFGIGTDNTRNDAFRLLDAAEATQRIAYGVPLDDFSTGGGLLWLTAATAGGADAAGLGGKVGALADGQQADFLILDATGPERQPSWDLAWELVRFYDRSTIAAAVVAGVPRVIGGSPVGWDLQAFLTDALPKGIDLVRKAGMVQLHKPSSLGLSSSMDR